MRAIKTTIRVALLKIVALSTFSILTSSAVFSEDITIPLERTIATQSVTQLEIISTVKTLMAKSRVLSIKKQSSYSNPDCHHVKALSQNGEFQNIKIGCYIQKLAQNNSNN